MRTNKISILIVLYNKQISDSLTINSLLQISDSLKPNLLIVNNGPESLTTFDVFKKINANLFSSVCLSEHLENRSLSRIYNDFINWYNESDYFVFFDDDSSFDPSVINNIFKSDAAVILPLIQSQSDAAFYYPIVNGKVLANECVVEQSNVISISSGLALNRNMVGIMSSRFGAVFDEHFALYGVDTSFYARLHDCYLNDIKPKIVCQGMILHSLSRSEKKPLSAFRVKERLYDSALIARHYPNRERNVYLLKKIIQNLYRCNFSNLSLLIKCYISGKHPRS